MSKIIRKYDGISYAFENRIEKNRIGKTITNTFIKTKKFSQKIYFLDRIISDPSQKKKDNKLQFYQLAICNL